MGIDIKKSSRVIAFRFLKSDCSLQSESVVKLEEGWLAIRVWMNLPHTGQCYGINETGGFWGRLSRPVPAAPRAAGAAAAGDSDALASEVNRCLIWSSPKVQLVLAYCNIYLEADATLYMSEATSVMALNYVLPHACCPIHEETEPKVAIYE